MNTDRELFIQELVAALQEKKVTSNDVLFHSNSSAEHDSHSSSESDNTLQEFTGLFQSHLLSPSPTDRMEMARDAYNQLQFDFPQVHDASIEALAEIYRHIVSDKFNGLVFEFSITATLLDGVTYLNDQTLSDHNILSSSSNSSGLLAASILLLVFRFCLEKPKHVIVDELLSLVVQPEQMLQTLQDDTMTHHVGMKKNGDDTIKTSFEAKLQFLASRTFSSSFDNVPIEKWKLWHLDDEIIAIIKLLLGTHSFQDESTGWTREESAYNITSILYGPSGEWSRYLFILRDRVLHSPDANRTSLWYLQQLLNYFHSCHFIASPIFLHVKFLDVPHYLVYRVLLELAQSQEFQLQSSQRASQELSKVIEEVLPLFMEEMQYIVSLSSATIEYEKFVTEKRNQVATVIMQLLNEMLLATSNLRAITKKLYASGMIRTLLMLLPSEIDHFDLDGNTSWVSAFLRLIGECTMWYADIAVYLSRVAKFVKLLPIMQNYFVTEIFLVAFAFHQHEIPLQNGLNIKIWDTFQSTQFFPLLCNSYLDSVTKLQNVLFVLNSLQKSLRILRPVVQEELQQNLKVIYANLTQFFKYPKSTKPQVLKDSTRIIDKEKEGEEAETLQYVALQNKLRQSIKLLLIAQSSNSQVDGCVTSKFD
ncbi:uncharacterized protein PHALS_06284 [Plasmopara halstedii]|uniref:Uncharacterized protein n=1 Tax=Plasmopara halstedii TaxID=4781 RepID=A0A0P1B464_PLAHL|nr:uncharacterized protein PHALS_06284 [Plasmopara halstedii]CEG48464.1 hypothetical protein PHALS_06284 [Plasmopara halstedii]|eukprot:XP_024584833.1 hypothetical protein PHALS_06284 [Plasmopara halstedii]